MSIFQDLKAVALDLRKLRDAKAVFLSTVISRAESLAKAENPSDPTVTDDHAIRAINYFIKSARDNMEMFKDRPETQIYQKSQLEVNTLARFLPAEASREDVVAAIQAVIDADAGQTAKGKLTGTIMKEITTKFGASLNKKDASLWIKEILG